MSNQQSPQPPLQNFSIAPLWRRLLAMVYDTFLLFGITMLYGLIYILGKKAFLGVDNFDYSATAGGGPLMLAIWFCVIFLFFYWFWHRSGQTLGMQTWRIKVIQNNGQPITARQTLIRLLVAVFSLSAAGIGFLWCLFGNKRTWQDIASDTQVFLIPKKNTSQNK